MVQAVLARVRVTEAERLWLEGTDVAPEHRPHSRIRTLTGLAGYYAVRLPFMAYKGYKEWYGSAGQT